MTIFLLITIGLGALGMALVSLVLFIAIASSIFLRNDGYGDR
jgi:hypothetical protein